MEKNSAKHRKSLDCDMAIIGAGLAGMAASLFSVNRGLSTVQISETSSLPYSSGLFDILGYYPTERQSGVDDPWSGIREIQNGATDHPYSRIPIEMIQDSLREVSDFLGKAGLLYKGLTSKNSYVMTPLGTLKPTGLVPASMWKGIEAYNTRSGCLLIGFKNLREFSSRQIASTLSETWGGLRAETLVFPKIKHVTEIHPEYIARSLESPMSQERFIQDVNQLKRDEEYIGFPAILGVHHTSRLIETLERETKAKVFEIPTLPISVPGLRLKEIFEKRLEEKGLTQLRRHSVSNVTYQKNGGFSLLTNEGQTISANAIVLASGRFLSKGLLSDRRSIKEPLFNLPVYQPTRRDQWHEEDFFHPKGHAVNSAGIEVNATFNPVGPDKTVIYPNLYVCGSILAHQDWMRMKCGSGSAISTAYAAIHSYVTRRDANR